MKLNVEKYGLAISVEGTLEESYVENVLGLIKDRDSVRLVRNDGVPCGCTLHTEVMPNRIVSISVDIKGYGKNARFHATAKMLDGERFGIGKTLKEALGDLFDIRDHRDAELDIYAELPCNANYRDAGI